MKAIILAGGLGTRFSEETHSTPKPMIRIGSQPIMWHIMKIYSHWNINDFILCLGYKSEVIKSYFNNYQAIHSSFNINTKTGHLSPLTEIKEDWNVTLYDTGPSTMTGGRILMCKEFINQTFSVTYGDSLLNINIGELIKFHKSHGKLATVTGIKKSSRLGLMKVEGNCVTGITEEGEDDPNWINGGFFILEPGIFDYIEGDNSIWEREPLNALAKAGELMIFQHHGFWHPMDTIYDKNNLEKLWLSESPPWKIWE